MYATYGEALRNLRLKLGFTQTLFAKALGISQAQLSTHERSGNPARSYIEMDNGTLLITKDHLGWHMEPTVLLARNLAKLEKKPVLNKTRIGRNSAFLPQDRAFTKEEQVEFHRRMNEEKAKAAAAKPTPIPEMPGYVLPTVPAEDKVIRLGKNRILEMHQVNKVRAAAGAALLHVRVRTCPNCTKKFEHLGGAYLCPKCKPQQDRASVMSGIPCIY